MCVIERKLKSARNTSRIFVAAVLFLFSSLASFAEQTASPQSVAERAQPTDFLSSFLVSPELWEQLADEAVPLEKTLDRVHKVEYFFPYAPGKRIFVTEFFTIRTILRTPARAAIFLTGPEFRGNFWSIPVDGYNGPEIAAKRGFFAFTMDIIGIGKSYLPEDGSKINYLTQVPSVRKLIDFIRHTHQVHRVDLVGEGFGAEIAAQLADEPWRVRSVVMSVLTYKNLSPEILPFFSAELEAFLRGQPNGYYEFPFFELTLEFSPNEMLRDYVLETQSGLVPTGPSLQYWDFGLPTIDAAAASVPGLVIASEFDPFPAPGDMAELADDWGGGGTLVVIGGAHHVPRIESEEIAAKYFEALFDFIDP